nr:hypothetical protein [Taylorella asinigenitalis]
MDTYIPTPERAVDGTFLMPVEDVFSPERLDPITLSVLWVA